ncbi:MAG: LLM class flavin-dependent oxidoreductase [Propionibacteriales bacterium]|nr:LLM class flavin-dependent oxidoreductase [Propionibacteriales bacterium]
MTTPDKLEFAVTLPVFDSLLGGIPPVQRSARLAEDLGFDSVWAGDHLFFHRPNHECIVALAAAAGATESIGLGAGVLLPALREPVALAKQLTTLCHVSDGRFLLGVGVGGEYGPEWEAVGVDPRERGARTDDFLEYFDTVLQGASTDFHGRHLRVTTPAMLPPPSRRPPVWVGGRSDAALRRAVRHGDGWLSVWSSPRRIAAAREDLARVAEEENGPVPRLGLVVFCNVGAPEKALEEGRAFVEGHYALSFEKMEKWFLTGEPDAIAERLLAYREAGVSLFMLYPGTRDPSSQFEAVREVAELVRTG